MGKVFIIKNQFVSKQKNTKFNKKYYILTKGIYQILRLVKQRFDLFGYKSPAIVIGTWISILGLLYYGYSILKLKG